MQGRRIRMRMLPQSNSVHLTNHAWPIDNGWMPAHTAAGGSINPPVAVFEFQPFPHTSPSRSS